MQVTFSQNKKYVLFIHKDHKEYKALTKFPAFIKVDQYYGCHAVLPVVHNVIARCTRHFRVELSNEVQTWLTEPFKLKVIPENFEYFTKPKDFQEIALRFLYTLGSAGILLDPGMGKSKVILDYIALQGFKRSYIICPAPLLFVWEDEILRHRPDLTYHVLGSTDWEVELPKLVDKQVVILNYNKAVILKHRLKELDTDFIHVDEFLIKDPSTNRTQSITELSRKIPYRAGGSGTLINNSPMDAFCPTRYLQPSLVGWNYSNFLNTYAVIKEAKARFDSETTRKVIVAFRGKDEIRAILESCSIVMTKDKWLKLPEKHFHDIYVPMGETQKKSYYQLMKNYYLQVGNKEILIDNPLVMLSKLYQISQGFLYLYNEEEKEVEAELLAGEIKAKKKKKKSDREVYYFPEQPKIEALKKLLQTTLSDKKCMIWFNLDGEFQLIQQLLDELGESYLSIQGGDKKLGEKVRRFNKDPSIKRLVCQAKSVNYGITVLGSKKEELEDEDVEVFPGVDPSVWNQVFYSINFSLEVYLQQQDRIHRLGQEHECHYYRIFALSPVETKLRETIADKVYLKEEMLVDVVETLLSTEETSEVDNSIS
jgi:SNF2 family DNA or RNA helicase